MKKSSKNFIGNERRVVWVLFLIVLFSRLLALPFAEVRDADAVTRIYMAEKWLLDPHLISEGIWLPFHHYFNALSLWVWSDVWYSPMVFNSLLTALTVFPLYAFTKREFHERGARLAVVVYLFSSVVFHNSFHALSELPNAVFIMFALDQMSLLVREKKMKHAVLAGLFMTIAAGFRYESWLLIAIFSGMLLLFRVPIRSIFVFGLVAIIFPVFWMAGNWLAHGDLFFGLSGAYNWNVVMEGVNDHIDGIEKIKRLLFFPLSWLLVFSPILVFLVLFRFLRKWQKRDLQKTQLIWILPFIIVLSIFIYKSFEGTLLNQHRFTILPLLLTVPFTAWIVETTKTKWMEWVAYASIPLFFWLSFRMETIEFEKWIPSDRVEQAVRQIRLSTFSTLSAIPQAD
jgi:4-amino-4-deoxy-L-arabinose transferase-like glycosyltransferase